MRASAALAALCCLALPAAAQPSVSAALDRAVVGVDQYFYLTVTAQGTRVSEPELPVAPDLVIEENAQGHRRSMQVQIINGRVTQTVTNEWTYEATFSSVGKKEIPPVKVQIDGKDYLTPKLGIEVVAQSAIRSQPQQRPGTRQPSAQNQTPPTEMGLDDLVYLECEIDRNQVYQGEPLLLTVRFGSYWAPGVMVRGAQGNSISLPSIEGCYEGDIHRDERYIERDGQTYSETAFSRAIVATRSGDLVVPSVSWQGRVTAPTRFGPSSANVEKYTDTLTLHVKPLPDAPGNFSGAVGRFSFQTSIEPGPVVQGAPKKFTVLVAGEGNADSVAKPDFPDLDWCHVTEPEIQVNQLEGPLQFEKSFVYTLTPSESARHTIPSIEFCFFSPELGNYKTLKSNPVEVTVKEGSESGDLVVVGGTRSEQSGVLEVLGDDIAPIETRHRGLSKPPLPLAADVVFTGVPPMAFAACALLLRHRRRLEEDTGYARTRRARSRSMKRLRKVAGSADPAEELYKALTGYLGDKLNMQDAGLTSNDVSKVMSSEGFPEALRDGYAKILRACERHRYAGDTLNAHEVQALTEAAAKAMDDLDDALAEQRRARA
ncbi:MAG: hypothetical protein GC168_11855 [Candidatus Hydrogenedens sp.]|nr:hypothetical protein [Candidatus Hydrogenedens sp.]